jgi:hypothetical protein
MDYMNVFQLEDLPVEILVEIFQYLTTHELYFSFSHLNIRINLILKSLPNLNLITTYHADPVLSFFNSFKAIQLKFNRFNSSLLSEFNFSNFVNIHSFMICSETHSDDYIKPIEQINIFICPDLCPQLQSLWLPYCSQSLTECIFAGAFPYLKICHLYDTTYRKIILLSPTINILPSLCQLTIGDIMGYEFEKILIRCPNLRYLDFTCYGVLPRFCYLNSSYSSLKHLRLSRIESFSFHNGQFDSLLSFFPNLIHFDLTVYRCPSYDETIDFEKVAHCLHHHLPRLRRLEFYIYLTNNNHCLYFPYSLEQISQLHPLFICLAKDRSLLHIASYDFTSIHYYNRRYLRPASN